jgi:hypothetical protein
LRVRIPVFRESGGNAAGGAILQRAPRGFFRSLFSGLRGRWPVQGENRRMHFSRLAVSAFRLSVGRRASNRVISNPCVAPAIPRVPKDVLDTLGCPKVDLAVEVGFR